MLDVDVDDACEGRVTKFFAFGEFVLIKALVVVVHDEANDGMLRIGGLDEHLALLVRASGASGHLLHHVEGAFARAEVGETDHGVGIENAHDAHRIEVKSLGHHLRAHEDVGLVSREFVDDAVVTVLVACGVEVHARDFLAREHLIDVVLDALGAIAHNLDAGQSAGGTQVGQTDGVSAIVA